MKTEKIHLTNDIEVLKSAYEQLDENDEDYAVFTSMLEAHKWGDSNCKYDYTVKTSKMF